MGDDLMLMRVTPEMVLQEWLTKNKDSLRMQPERDIRTMARIELGSKISAMDSGDIGWEIHKWAEKNSLLPVNWDGASPSIVPGTPGAAPVRAGDSEAMDKLKALMKTLGTIPTELKWVGDGVTAGISFTGATISGSGNGVKAQVTAGWDRTVEFKTDVRGMTFSAKIDPVNQNWTGTFTIGRQAPNLSDVANVFQAGDSAAQNVLQNAGKVDLSNLGKTAQLFAPDLAPIKAAVDAASKIAAQRPGDISFGVSLKGGLPGTPGASGVTATGLFTIVF